MAGYLSSRHGSFRLHFESFLNTGRPGSQAVRDLPIPWSFHITLGLCNHRFWLQVAKSIYLARSDRCHRGVNRFGVKLRSGEREFRVVIKPFGRFIQPAPPCFEPAIIKARQEGARIAQLLTFATLIVAWINQSIAARLTGHNKSKCSRTPNADNRQIPHPGEPSGSRPIAHPDAQECLVHIASGQRPDRGLDSPFSSCRVGSPGFARKMATTRGPLSDAWKRRSAQGVASKRPRRRIVRALEMVNAGRQAVRERVPISRTRPRGPPRAVCGLRAEH